MIAALLLWVAFNAPEPPRALMDEIIETREPWPVGPMWMIEWLTERVRWET